MPLPLFAVSDVVYQALIAGVVTLILAWMNQRTKTAVVSTAKEAVAKAEEVKVAVVDEATRVKKDLAIATARQDDKLGVIHGLVNSALGDVKRSLAVTARSKATITNDPADIAAAEAAEQDSDRHDQTQTEQNTGGKNG